MFRERMKQSRQTAYFMVMVLLVMCFDGSRFGEGKQSGQSAMAAGQEVAVLNDERMDGQGLYYVLYDDGTALAGSNLQEDKIPTDGKIKIPERVQYHGGEWRISKVWIGVSDISDKITEVTFPDSNIEVNFYSSPNLKKIHLGKYTRLTYDRILKLYDDIEIDLGSNVYYERVNDGIYLAPTYNRNRILVYQEDTGREIVRVPDGTTVISNNAFAYNNSIKKVILPDSCTDILGSAFQNSSLENIWLGNVNLIAGGAFDGCTSLQGIVIQKDVALYSFYAGRSMKMFYMGGRLTSNNSSNSYAFSSDSLEYVLLGEVKQMLGQERMTVKDLNRFKGFVIPDSYTQKLRVTFGDSGSVPMEKQKSCSHSYGNTEVLYQDDLQVVKGQVCRECKHVRNVTVEKKTEAYTEAVADDSQPEFLDSYNRDSQGITYRLDASNLTAAAIGFSGTESVKLPVKVKNGGKVYTVVGVEASSGSPKILDTGSSCYYIGDYALDLLPIETLKLGKTMSWGEWNNGHAINLYGWGRLKKLKKIELDPANGYFCLDGNMIYSIGNQVLWQYIDKTCHMDYVTLPVECTSIRANAFYSADIEGIDLDRVTRLYRGVFSESKVKSICRVSDTELDIWKEQGEFKGCTSLQSVFIKNLKLVSDSMFEGDTSLEYVVLDGAVSRLRDSMFKDCTKLKAVYLSDKVNTILGNVFYRCTSLEKLYIPESVTKIDSSAFSGCNALKIYGKAGSYAQTFASANNIPFEAVNLSDVVYDQTITIEDAHASVMIPFSSSCGHMKLSGAVTNVSGVVITPTPASSEPSSSGTSAPVNTNTPSASPGSTPVSSPRTEGTSSSAPAGTNAPNVTKHPSATVSPNGSTSQGDGKNTSAPYVTNAPGTSGSTGNSTAAPDKTGQNTNPTGTGNPKPSENPSVIHAPEVTNAPGSSEGKEGQSNGDDGDSSEASVSVFKKSTLFVRNQTVMKISWKNLGDTGEYHIYRGTKKNKLKLYKRIFLSEEERLQDTLVFKDKKISYMKIYYYQVRTPDGREFKLLAGKATGLFKPKISVKKGKTENIRFLTVKMKKYAGDSIQIYIRKNKGKYKRLKLKMTEIKKAKKTFKLALAVKNKTISLKVRTYRKKRKGIYSAFSKVVKIKV